MIGEGTKIFWKYQLAVWLSIQNFYLHFTKLTHKCECFGHIVDPCVCLKHDFYLSRYLKPIGRSCLGKHIGSDLGLYWLP